jgi:hypothetical protein
MKRILLSLLGIALLVAPAAASAKRLTSAAVCGSSGCNSSSHPAAFVPTLEGGPPIAGGPARAHPFYRLRLVVDEGRASESMKLLVVPQGRYLRGPDGVWRQVSADVLGPITTLAKGLRPFPASQLPGVTDSPPQSDPDISRAAPRPGPVESAASFPWLTVGSVAAALLFVGLALGFRRSRGLATRTRTIREASGRQGPP